MQYKSVPSYNGLKRQKRERKRKRKDERGKGYKRKQQNISHISWTMENTHIFRTKAVV